MKQYVNKRNSANKGKVLRYCAVCNHKRFCSREPIPNYNFRITCSKGHSWVIEGLTLERINAAVRDTFDKEKMKNLFERDDTFYSILKNK